MQISQSRVKSWRTCRAQYYYRYIKKLRKKQKSRPLVFGSLIHRMLEFYIEGKNPRLAIEEIQGFQSEQEFYGNLIEDAVEIFENYLEYHKDSKLTYVKRKGRKSEHEVVLEVESGVEVLIRVDGLAVADKLKWLVEHKTFKRLPNEDQRWRNLQSAVYIKVLQLTGVFEPDGILWDYIHSQNPGDPKILKNGEISTTSLNCFPSRLKKFTDNPTLIGEATKNLSNHFKRIKTPVNQSVVDAVFEDFILTSKEILELHYKTKPVKNIAFHCSFCDYEALCRGELQGNDVDYLIEALYYENTAPVEEPKIIETE